MRKYLLISLAVVSLLLFVQTVVEAKPYKIFLLFSYSPEYSWEQGLIEGVKKALKGVDTKVTAFHMKTKRNTSSTYIKQIAQKAIKLIQNTDPDIIISFDDNALKYVSKKFYKKKYKIVFGGINADPVKDYGIKPGYNITGILEKTYPVESIKLLKAMTPDVKTTFLIVKDAYSSRIIYKSLIKNMNPPTRIESVAFVNELEEYKKAVFAAQKSADSIFIIGSLYLKDGNRYVDDDFVIPWTIKHSRIPEAAIIETQVGYGALCGVVTDAERHGYATAKLALEVLKGKPIQNIPFITPKFGDIAINIHRAKMLDLPIPFGLLLESKLFASTRQ